MQRALSLAPLSLLASCALLTACATVPESTPVNVVLPNASAGPFRALAIAELGNSRSAPNVIDEPNTYARDAAVIFTSKIDSDPSSLEVDGYFGATIATMGTTALPTSPTNAILRFGALDGRSFNEAAEKVLVLDSSWEWENGVLATPSVLRVKGGGTEEVLLYYASYAAIGLARSKDGHAFSRRGDPVLLPEAGSWEKGLPPRSPGVVQLADGSFRMFYEIAFSATESAIGEAKSADGVTWTRVGNAPALARSPAVAGEPDPYDSASVGAPFPMLATTEEGRATLRVYYGARDGAGNRTIGLAARFGDDGPLLRGESPVFGSGGTLGPSEPCVMAFGGSNAFSLLYATERADATDDHEAVAGAVAPGNAVLPAPNPM